MIRMILSEGGAFPVRAYCQRICRGACTVLDAAEEVFSLAGGAEYADRLDKALCRRALSDGCHRRFSDLAGHCGGRLVSV